MATLLQNLILRLSKIREIYENIAMQKIFQYTVVHKACVCILHVNDVDHKLQIYTIPNYIIMKVSIMN